MKNNEEKLKKLLEVAFENGWKDFYIETHILQHSNSVEFLNRINLNDLIINWEENEISFIDALCVALINEIENYNSYFETYNLIFNSGREVWICKPNQLTGDIIREYWCNKPTSQRLEWLFSIFNHLL